MPPTGRLAPSPTGLLHLGHARSFLIAWWSARRESGRVLLRHEDLDAPRVEPGHIEAIRRDLRWLGLDWDEEQLQSTRLSLLNQQVEELVSTGQVYPCICSRKDIIEAQSAPHGLSRKEYYPGTCRGRFSSVAAASAQAGQPAGLRFRVPPGVVQFEDLVYGAQLQNVAELVGDFLVAKRSGAPAYQLAVVVDDHASGVTEIIRGNDLLSSTPRQILLRTALGYPIPRYAHLPLVLDEQGKRLAKRYDSLSLAKLRYQGVTPERIVHWAASSCGLIPPPNSPKTRLNSEARASELLSEFDWRRLSPEDTCIDPSYFSP